MIMFSSLFGLDSKLMVKKEQTNNYKAQFGLNGSMNTGSGFQGLDSLTEHAILLFSVLNRVSCTGTVFCATNSFFCKKNISMMQASLA